MQSDINPNGWACFPIDPPKLLPDGEAIPSVNKSQVVVQNMSYSFYALSSTDCSNGGQRINKLSMRHYKVTKLNAHGLNVNITDYGLDTGQN